MEPETTPATAEPETNPAPTATAPEPEHIPHLAPVEPDGIGWIFFGKNGLRVGWSLSIFAPLMMLLSGLAGAALLALHLIDKKEHLGPLGSLYGEMIPLIGLLGAAAIVALVEQRPGNLLGFNLLGRRRVRRFCEGLVLGFAALSALIAALRAGGWIEFTKATWTRPELLHNAALWAGAFLLVACFEEGLFRCYLQATLTRGMNLWWAMGWQAVLCGILLARSRGSAAWGVYAIALLGLFPCALLEVWHFETTPFWQTAWVTSSLFGFVHISNNGENWIGIFAAAAIGFVFCVSIKLTGSAWWAIGFHAAWDWAETFFYGTADSGLAAQGSYLIAKPSGNALFSGGSDGPEGSLLILGILALLFFALLAFYLRRPRTIEELQKSLRGEEWRS